MNAQTPIPPNQGPVMQGMPGGPMPGGQGMHPGMIDEGGVNIARIIDTLWDDRKFIALITAIVTVIGVIWAIVATPYYEASITVQVEDSNNPAANIIGDLAGGDLFPGKNKVLGETEILRSRMVVKKAVDNLNIDIEVRPKRFPVFGDFLARRQQGIFSSGVFGAGGYCWGQENIDIRKLETETHLLDKPFEVRIIGEKNYLVTMPDGTRLKGDIGKSQSWNTPSGEVKIYIKSASAKEGAIFLITRRDRIQAAIELIENLEVKETIKGSEIVRATLTGEDATQTADTLNEIGRQYVLQNVERKGEEAASTLSFLDTQLPKLRSELDLAEQKFNEFRKNSGTIDLGEEAKAALTQAMVAQQRLTELMQQRAQMTARLTSAHPSVIAINSQIVQAKSRIESLEVQIKNLPEIEQDLLGLTRDLQVKTQLYQQLLNASQELQIVRASKVGNVRIIDDALPPKIATKPKRKLIVMTVSALGFFLGFALAILKIVLKGGIEHPDDIERVLGVTVYATIPMSSEQEKISTQLKRNSGRQVVLAAVSESDPAIESLRSLRTALQFVLLDSKNNVTMISGPTPGIGKSFVSANLASVLAAGGKRVLLIDGDIRKGYLNQYFGLERSNGLADVICGRIQLHESIRSEVLPGLDFIPTGTLPPNPSELLLHANMKSALDELSQEYDQIIIDSPPVLIVSDATVLGNYAGNVFLVAREGVTTMGEVDDSIRRLQQSGNLVRGVIFNGVRRKISSYYNYSSKYGYGYRGSSYRYQSYLKE